MKNDEMLESGQKKATGFVRGFFGFIIVEANYLMLLGHNSH